MIPEISLATVPFFAVECPKASFRKYVHVAGKLVMESILETKASTILEFFAGLRGTLLVTFEEGTWAAWAL
jgi:hypothetical protein